MTVPVVILASVDPVLRDAALFSVLTDLPGTGVLRQDLDPTAGTLRRVISDETGVAEDQTVPLAHTCLGCAIREDSLPSLESMIASGRWQRIIWALPVAAETTPAARPLANPDIAGRIGAELAGVVALADTDTLTDDIMGDDLLADRGLALSEHDRRSVGEALAAQLGHADLVLTTGSERVGTTLAEHLRGVRAHRSELFATSALQLFLPRYVHHVAEARTDPRLVLPPDASDADGVWSLDLGSRRPLHPLRFSDRLSDLGSGRVRSRGRFQLASRPRTVGEWDSAGGQLSIGDAGGWEGATPSTRLIFTGTGNDRDRITGAFADVLLTDREIAAGPRFWRTMDDGLDAWLGDRERVS
jgi:G3E family GTPase